MKALLTSLCGALVIGAAAFMAPATHDNIILDGTSWSGPVDARAKISLSGVPSWWSSDWMGPMSISSGEISFSTSMWGSWAGSIQPREGKIRFHDFNLYNFDGELNSWASNALWNIADVSADLSSATGSGYVRGRWSMDNILMRQTSRFRGFGMVKGQPRTFTGQLNINGVLWMWD